MRVLPALLWTAGYLVLVAFPLLVLLARPAQPGFGFWWDLSMALGFAGLAVVGVQFGLTARFRRASAPFGIDILYYFHRWMAVAGFGLLLAHWLVLRITAPGALVPWLPWQAPWMMTAGRVALIAFGAIVVTSLWRRPLRIEYDRWRILHAALAVGAVLLALQHVLGAATASDDPVRRALWASYTLAWVALVVFIRVVRPWRVRRTPWRVREVRAAPGRTWTLTLEPDGHPGLRFRAGQFAWLTLRASPFAAKEHPFSFSGSAETSDTLEFTIKELGDFTRTLGTVRPGEVAWVDGPYGSFSVDRFPEAPGFFFVGGGVGIAPIVGMLRTLADRGDRRPLRLVYADDREEELLFQDELRALAGRLDLRVWTVLREPPPGWRGENGLIDAALLERVLPPDAASQVYFLCGPEPMSDAVHRALHARGVPLRRIHFELFDMA